MKSIICYLDDLKDKFGSDYMTAKKLNVTKEAISKIRKRKQCGDETAIKIADLLNIERSEVLIAAAIARNEGEVKSEWENISKKAGVAAGLIFAIMSGIPHPAETAKNVLTGIDNIHYAKLYDCK